MRPLEMEDIFSFKMLYLVIQNVVLGVCRLAWNGCICRILLVSFISCDFRSNSHWPQLPLLPHLSNEVSSYVCENVTICPSKVRLDFVDTLGV